MTSLTQAPISWPVWRLAGVIVFGAFASGLDASLANIGLDTIGANLHAPLARTQWVASGYLVALAVSLPLAGWLGRKRGVGRLWLTALASFTVASGLCAVAPTIETLILMRVVQGLAGGLLIPAGQTVLGQAVGAQRLGRVMATLGIAVSVAPALGPVIGGLVLHSLSWRWLFAINLPVGVLGLLLGWRYVPRGQPGAAPRLDRVGLLYISTGLPLVVYAVTELGAHGSGADVVPLLLGLVALAVFGVRSVRQAEPLLDLRLFVNRSYAAAGAAAGFTGMALFGSGLLFPLYFQLAHGEDVVGTGLRLLGLGGATALALPLTGRLTDRYGGGAVSLGGCTLLVLVSASFAVLPVDTNAALVQVLLGLLGISVAFAAVPTGISAYQTVSRDQLPDATVQVNILQRLGGAVGGALFSVVLARRLPAGAQVAFHAAFWTMTAAACIALISAFILSRTLRPAP
jgi:EmrB/QacA subfamily drug resistance transporter